VDGVFAASFDQYTEPVGGRVHHGLFEVQVQSAGDADELCPHAQDEIAVKLMQRSICMGCWLFSAPRAACYTSTFY
jgi:hypothetical protein